MSDLYEADILAWSEEQARRLQRVAANDRHNEDSPDWVNIIEEIEDVGRSQLHAVEGHLVQALLHDLKAEAWPLRGRCRTGGRKREASVTMRAPSSRQRWRRGSTWRSSIGEP